MAAASSNGLASSANGTPNNRALYEATNIGNLSNKIALITGASSGLGRAIAQAYAAAGAFVVNADLTPNPPHAPILANTFKTAGHVIDLTTPTVDLLNSTFPSTISTHPRATYVQLDVTKAASMEAAVRSTVATYGRLDIMVNNAGIAAEISEHVIGAQYRTHDLPEEIYDKDMAINSKGVWLGIKYAVGQMLNQEPHVSGDRGWVINMCSIMGLVATPGASPYCASKGAVLQLTKTAALEYAKDKIHINCINPGFAETSLLEPMMAGRGVEENHQFLNAIHPWGRLALPEDIAKMAVFLAGPGASFCTGQAFVVDGGYTAQ